MMGKYAADCRYHKNGKKHGLESHRFYNTWLCMLRRCYDPSHKFFNNYGGRGIDVFHEWKESPAGFITFIESIGGSNDCKLTIDRVDVNDGYYPWNIRLADAKMQANNTTRNRLLTYGNCTLTMAQWADKLNIPYARLQTRIQRGWEIRRALFTN